MRVWLALASVVVVALIVASWMGFSFRVGPVFSVCSRDDEIAAAEYGEIVDAAEDFLALLRTDDVAGARNSMSRAARAVTQVEGLETAASAAQSDGGQSAAVDEVFKLFAPLGSGEGMSLCGAPSEPDLVSRQGGMNSALVTLVQPLVGGERTWTIYLERDRGAWRVRHLHLTLSAIGERDGAAFRELARGQTRAGNGFNATILYDLSALLLARGESFVPSEAYGLSQERSERHPDLVGGVPFTFRLGEEQHTVSLVNVTGTAEGEIVLLLEQMRDPPGDRATAIARNRALIDAMNAHRPEWRDAFDALVAAYPTGGRSVWRTVYGREDGYLSTVEEELASEP